MGGEREGALLVRVTAAPAEGAANEAILLKNEAVLKKSEAANQWSYYQQVSTKAHLMELAKALTPADVVWSYSGVRPLFDEDGSESASAVSRDYVLDLEENGGKAPLLNVFGGKITTHRPLAEEAMAEACRAAMEQWPAEGVPANPRARLAVRGGGGIPVSRKCR